MGWNLSVVFDVKVRFATASGDYVSSPVELECVA